MVKLSVKTVLLEPLKVSDVVLVEIFPAKLRFVPERVLHTGTFAPPKEYPPLKLIVPALVKFDNVPELCVNNEPNVNVPVVTEMTSLAGVVFAAYVTIPETFKEPDVTTIAASRDAVASVPPMLSVPDTVAVPALIFHPVVTPAVG